MSQHTPHELAEDFPQHVEAIRALRAGNAHFAKIADEYHALNREVHRSETNVAPMDELAETELRKRRAALKDEIWSMLQKASV
ncbi:YdcH family protein [Aestuariicoccus sp. MJ-SS9]|uniref:YdcH family protein n=1 Tax=Aestuariicoccus sp. MJ-SS9 TaxID=3079855 RepID=UPI002914ED6D|nr:YdcH family protein [Aestuariicoccus sp. MJ-SS9]MDU8914126.1 YdcH family protein [Aestuariicoccus sp. MJ-SS9]